VLKKNCTLFNSHYIIAVIIVGYIIIIDDSILHYTFTLLLYIPEHERETTLISGTIFLCTWIGIFTAICIPIYKYKSIVADVEQYMLISHHNVVVSYKNRFYHNFTNTRGEPRCIYNNIILNIMYLYMNIYTSNMHYYTLWWVFCFPRAWCIDYNKILL